VLGWLRESLPVEDAERIRGLPAARGLDGAALLALTEGAMREDLLIGAFGARRKLSQRIRQLAEELAAESTPQAASAAGPCPPSAISAAAAAADDGAPGGGSAVAAAADTINLCSSSDDEATAAAEAAAKLAEVPGLLLAPQLARTAAAEAATKLAAEEAAAVKRREAAKKERAEEEAAESAQLAAKAKAAEEAAAAAKSEAEAAAPAAKAKVKQVAAKTPADTVWKEDPEVDSINAEWTLAETISFFQALEKRTEMWDFVQISSSMGSGKTPAQARGFFQTCMSNLCRCYPGCYEGFRMLGYNVLHSDTIAKMDMTRQTALLIKLWQAMNITPEDIVARDSCLPERIAAELKAHLIAVRAQEEERRGTARVKAAAEPAVREIMEVATPKVAIREVTAAAAAAEASAARLQAEEEAEAALCADRQRRPLKCAGGGVQQAVPAHPAAAMGEPAAVNVEQDVEGRPAPPLRGNAPPEVSAVGGAEVKSEVKAELVKSEVLRQEPDNRAWVHNMAHGDHTPLCGDPATHAQQAQRLGGPSAIGKKPTRRVRRLIRDGAQPQPQPQVAFATSPTSPVAVAEHHRSGEVARAVGEGIHNMAPAAAARPAVAQNNAECGGMEKLLASRHAAESSSSDEEDAPVPEPLPPVQETPAPAAAAAKARASGAEIAALKEAYAAAVAGRAAAVAVGAAVSAAGTKRKRAEAKKKSMRGLPRQGAAKPAAAVAALAAKKRQAFAPSVCNCPGKCPAKCPGMALGQNGAEWWDINSIPINALCTAGVTTAMAETILRVRVERPFDSGAFLSQPYSLAYATLFQHHCYSSGFFKIRKSSATEGRSGHSG
jgi:hypothetical protein